MPSDEPAPAVVPFDPDVPPRRAPDRWRTVDRSAYAPRLVTAGAGAALVTARPRAAYLKIVDAVGDVRAAVGAVVAHARDRGLAQVKWEGWTADPADAAALGFVPMQSPSRTEPRTGYVRWLAGGPGGAVAEPPYYRQSTNFTCGAVTALIAQAQAGAVPPPSLDRPAELTLWRAATNFPACEPVGLGVAVRRAWPTSPVTVFLDTDRPVLLDSYKGDEREWRAVLQRASRTDAADAGVPLDPRRLSLPGVRALLADGARVLLLLSLEAMQGFAVPHWVLCHAAVPGALVLEDPWTNDAAGDTWLDAHLLPVPDPALDAMSVMEDGRYRAAVAIGPPDRPGERHAR
ncbi:peptidase C39 family protein [Actinomadura sp. WAC 06369]|uniref:peptidase C39 family protein n=1 Tax=Actinomadura sp. WAC 06369 TaxID=2203193 RepID=UPI000F7869BC|nr:peptidase C39 family protein [Actinomadura sp. WAC 06369]RSN71817.1 acetyltransferase [Actinomadura sp. WAC 06369]